MLPKIEPIPNQSAPLPLALATGAPITLAAFAPKRPPTSRASTKRARALNDGITLEPVGAKIKAAVWLSRRTRWQRRFGKKSWTNCAARN